MTPVIICFFDDPENLARLCGKAGWYFTFEERPNDTDADWEGPFETQEAAQAEVLSLIETAAVSAVKNAFSK